MAHAGLLTSSERKRTTMLYNIPGAGASRTGLPCGHQTICWAII